MPAAAINNPGVQPMEDFQGPQRNGFGDMSSQDFLRIMMAELTRQDPLEPSDTSDILEQISSLRNIEGQIDLQEKLEELVLQNQLSEASGLIGRKVQGLTDEGERVEGLVTSVRIRNDEAVLELDTGRVLPMERVEKVMAVDEQGVAESPSEKDEPGSTDDEPASSQDQALQSMDLTEGDDLSVTSNEQDLLRQLQDM